MPLDYYFAEAKKCYADICEYKRQNRELLAIRDRDTIEGLNALKHIFTDTLHYIAKQTGNMQAYYEYVAR